MLHLTLAEEGSLHTPSQAQRERGGGRGTDTQTMGDAAGAGLPVCMLLSPLQDVQAAVSSHAVAWNALARCWTLLQLTGGGQAVSAWKLQPLSPRSGPDGETSSSA